MSFNPSTHPTPAAHRAIRPSSRFATAVGLAGLLAAALTSCAPAEDSGVTMVRSYLNAIADGRPTDAAAVSGVAPEGGDLLAEATETITEVQVGREADPEFKDTLDAGGLVPASYELGGKKYTVDFVLELRDDETFAMGAVPFATVAGSQGIYSLADRVISEAVEVYPAVYDVNSSFEWAPPIDRQISTPFGEPIELTMDAQSEELAAVLDEARPTLSGAIAAKAAECKADDGAEGCTEVSATSNFIGLDYFAEFVPGDLELNVQFTQARPVMTMTTQTTGSTRLPKYGGCLPIFFDYVAWATADVAADGTIGEVTASIEANVTNSALEGC